jgi:hypothetical protein
MGYYVKSLEGVITVTPENVDKALEAINAKLEEKHESLENALWDNQFAFEKDDEGYYRIYGFDDKWFEQDNLLYAVTPYMTEDSHMAFMGEENEIFVYTPEGVRDGKIVWER